MRSYRAELPQRFHELVQLLDLDVSVLDLAKPGFLRGLNVLCLDKVPLGLLLVLLQSFLGQALKEQVFVQLGNLNNKIK